MARSTLQHASAIPQPRCSRRVAFRSSTLARAHVHGDVGTSSVSEGSKQQPAADLSMTRRGVGLAAAVVAAMPLLHATMAAAVVPTAAEATVCTDAAVGAAVESIFKKQLPKTKAPLMLRLAFHDAGTYSRNGNDGGLNASIRYELDRGANFGLRRGWRVIDQCMQDAKKVPEAAVLTSADFIALAGAYAVKITGGPVIQLPVGRREAAVADADGRMPAESASATQQKEIFGRMGFTTREMVALLGAHTLGNKGFGDPLIFDNTYYKTLLVKPWSDPNDNMAAMIGLASDHVLPEDEECLAIIKQYADNQSLFFTDFAAAYTKMSVLGQEL